MNERPPLVSSEILLGSLKAAQELNIDLVSICLEHGIDPALLYKPSGYLRHSQVTRFLQVVAERYRCCHFGFLVGKHQPPMQLGALGEAMRLSPTVGKAIENGLRYHSTFSEGSKHELIVDHGTARLIRWDRRSYPFRSTQMRMLGIVLLYKVLKTLSGTGWKPKLVTFSFSKPDHPGSIWSFFGCPVLFDQASDSISFSDSVLSQPLASSNLQLLKSVTKQLDQSFSGSQPEETLPEKVRHYIRLCLRSRRCSVESCAQFLGLNARTLQRQLDRHQHNFRELLLQVRMDTARQYLRDSTISLTGLATLQGYQNQSAFSRAFKMEHGVSPKQWRENDRKERY